MTDDASRRPVCEWAPEALETARAALRAWEERPDVPGSIHNARAALLWRLRRIHVRKVIVDDMARNGATYARLTKRVT